MNTHLKEESRVFMCLQLSGPLWNVVLQRRKGESLLGGSKLFKEMLTEMQASRKLMETQMTLLTRVVGSMAIGGQHQRWRDIFASL